jgi:hypothetical protein
MSVGYYTPYSNGPAPTDRVAMGNSKAWFETSGSLFSTNYSNYAYTLADTWADYQTIAESRGISFYPDMTWTDIAVNFPTYRTRVIVKRLALLLGIPFHL